MRSLVSGFIQHGTWQILCIQLKSAWWSNGQKSAKECLMVQGQNLLKSFDGPMDKICNQLPARRSYGKRQTICKEGRHVALKYLRYLRRVKKCYRFCLFWKRAFYSLIMKYQGDTKHDEYTPALCIIRMYTTTTTASVWRRELVFAEEAWIWICVPAWLFVMSIKRPIPVATSDYCLPGTLEHLKAALEKTVVPVRRRSELIVITL